MLVTNLLWKYNVCVNFRLRRGLSRSVAKSMRPMRCVIEEVVITRAGEPVSLRDANSAGRRSLVR